MIDQPVCFQSKFRLRARVTLLFLVFLWFCTSGLAEDEYQGVGHIVAVGDIHGGYEDFVRILRTAHVIDGRNRWVSGETHLVQTGDLLDRGPDSRKVLDLLMDLESQAQEAGGKVHVLLGNHEALNLYGDLRYVSHEEFDSYKTPDSERLRAEAYEVLADPAQKQDRKYRKKWEEDHPLGWVEQRKAFSREGTYGRWLRQRNAVVKINNTVFVHGGISPKYVSLSLKRINSAVREELADFEKLRGGMVRDAQGPLWYRGLAETPEPEIAPHVEAVLTAYDIDHIVIAHTPTPGVIMPRLGGKVVMIDVGLSKLYGEVRACLVIDEGHLIALHRGSRLELPVNEDIAAYLRKALRLEPLDSPLYRYMNGSR